MLRISAKKRNRNCTNCSEKWVQNIFVNISEISPLFYFQLSKSFRIFFNPSISERTFEIMSMIVPRWRSQMTWLLPVKFLGSAEFQPEIMVEPPLMWTKPWDLDIISKPFRNALFIILDEPACFLAHPVSEFSEETFEKFWKLCPNYDFGSCAAERICFFLFLGGRLSPPPKPNEKALKEKNGRERLLSHLKMGNKKIRLFDKKWSFFFFF